VRLENECVNASGKPLETRTTSLPPQQFRQREGLARLRLGAEGFILSLAASSLLSIAAPLLLAPLIARWYYPLPPGQHFPPFPCVFIEALAFVLWLGPSALVWHVLLPAAATLGGVRLSLAIFLGLLSAYGRRDGVRAMVLISLVLLAVATLISAMFVSSG
jgi:hypothetical protein